MFGPYLLVGAGRGGVGGSPPTCSRGGGACAKDLRLANSVRLRSFAQDLTGAYLGTSLKGTYLRQRDYGQVGKHGRPGPVTPGTGVTEAWAPCVPCPVPLMRFSPILAPASAGVSGRPPGDGRPHKKWATVEGGKVVGMGASWRLSRGLQPPVYQPTAPCQQPSDPTLLTGPPFGSPP